MVPCSKCGQSIDPTKAVYSKQGELICKACDTSDIITEGYLRAAKGMCYGALASGLFSLLFNPFYLLSITALITGIRAVMLVSRQEYRSVLKGATGPLMAAAIIGIITGAVYPGLYMLGLAAQFVR